MTSIETNAVKETANGVSRRALLTGGLATGLLLAFHLPLRAAANEPNRAARRHRRQPVSTPSSASMRKA